MNTLWTELCEKGGVTLDATRDQALSRYLELLLAANERMNLTRITDPQAAAVHHVADALTLLPYIAPGPLNLADVGSGGGVPGIPLAIVRSDIHFTLIESTKKKAAFLRETADSLGLGNVAVTDIRAEELARTDQRESFDVVTARAVGALAWLAEWCLPLARKGGKVLAMKGAKLAEELTPAKAAIRRLGGGEISVHPVTLPGTEHHVIAEIPKIAKTEEKYPRHPTATRGRPIT